MRSGPGLWPGLTLPCGHPQGGPQVHTRRDGHTRIADLAAEVRRLMGVRGLWLRGLAKARLHQADLRSAVFWKARLIGADLRAADLTAADLTGARLGGARFDLADLRGADFTTADVAGAMFAGAVADDTTTWPDGFDPQQAGALSADKAPPFRPQSYSEDP